MRKRGIISLIAVACVQTAVAQDVDALFKKYQNQQAVITSLKEQLVIKNEGGQLVANSNVTREKLLIGEMSPGLYNKEYIYHSYFNKLEDYNNEALVPSKNGGYKKLDDPATKTVPSEDNNIFYDDAKETEITFTGLTPKSLLKTSYTLSHTDVHMLPPFFFQYGLPVAQSTYEVTVPKYVNIKFVIRGSHSDLIKQTRQENKNTVTYTFSSSDVPAFKDYDDVPSVAWYALQVVPYIASYELPGKERTEMLSDPAHLYSYMYDFVRNINVKEDEAIGKEVATLTKDDKTPREKAAHIYQWVQKNMHYIAFEDSLEGFIPRQAAVVYERKFGDCKDMASILVAMCRKAGIEAHFTWIGTRSKPYTYEETPLPMVDNHMICAIKLNDEWIFLDGTHPIIPFGAVPEGIQGKEAMIAIDDKTFKIITVPETSEWLSITNDTTFMKIDGKMASGRIIQDLSGYPAWETEGTMMYNINEDREKATKALNSRGSNKFVQKSYDYSQSDTGRKGCKLTAEYTIDDYVQKVDKEYYVNLNVNRYFEGHNIDTTGRDVAAFFKYKDIEREVVVLDIPKGYHVSYLPPEASGGIKDVWDYKISYRKDGGHVILVKEYGVHVMALAPKYFAEHNKIVDNLKKQYKESVVLTAD